MCILSLTVSSQFTIAAKDHFFLFHFKVMSFMGFCSEPKRAIKQTKTKLNKVEQIQVNQMKI